jgi:hypothetical protein
MAYDLLQEVMPGRCDRRYLQILELAAKEGEAQVEDALRLLLASERGKQTIADVPIPEVTLSSFDQLLSLGRVQ